MLNNSDGGAAAAAAEDGGSGIEVDHHNNHKSNIDGPTTAAFMVNQCHTEHGAIVRAWIEAG